jgi:hypothetical protein
MGNTSSVQIDESSLFQVVNEQLTPLSRMVLKALSSKGPLGDPESRLRQVVPDYGLSKDYFRKLVLPMLEHLGLLAVGNGSNSDSRQSYLTDLGEWFVWRHD